MNENIHRYFSKSSNLIQMKTTETSFGARLRRGQQMIEYLTPISVYQPPRQEESLDALLELLSIIESNNNSVVLQLTTYRDAVEQRMKAYKEDANSAIKLAGKAIASVDSLLGKEHIKSKEMHQIYRKLAGLKTQKIKPDAAIEISEKKISQFQTSFGSMLQHFSDLVTVLSQVQGYNPSNQILTVSNLQQNAAVLKDLTKMVDISAIQLQSNRNTRKADYLELKKRMNRVKSYIKSEYGLESTLYKNINKLSF